MPRNRKEQIIGIAALVVLAIVLALVTWLVAKNVLWPKEPSTSATAGPPLLPAISTPTGPTAVLNPYGPEDLVTEDGFMNLVDGETITGIDVSYYQKEIDWQQVADFGIEFVIVRLGCRGYESGSLIEDKMVHTYLQGARQAGLKIGAYFYSQAITVEEAREEARFALEILDGFQLELPIAYDWEYVSDTARTANMTGQLLMDCTVAFCETIREGGYEPMVYFNPTMTQVYLDLAELQQQGYPFWLAHYSDVMTFPYRVELWQYSYTGQVPGITGNVDLNVLLPHKK